MLIYLVGLVGAFLVVKGGSSNVVKPTGVKAVAGHTNPQTAKNPGTAQAPRADQGSQASQPWYQGPAVAAGSVAAVAITKGIVDLVSSVGDSWFKGSDDQIDADESEYGGDDWGLTDAGGVVGSEEYDPTVDTQTNEVEYAEESYFA